MEPDDYYEPDAQDFAFMRAQKKAIASLRSGYHGASRGLRDYQKYTDRQLRGLNKEKKTTALRLGRRFHFDVVGDSFEEEIADDVFVSAPYDEEAGEDEGPRSLTRKDKRRAKTEQRRAERDLRIWRTQWEKSCAASVVRKTGALVSAVAA
jgi:hypothetical protein